MTTISPSVINELDGLAKGGRVGEEGEGEDRAARVGRKARETIDYLELEFQNKHSHLRAQTSKGTIMETISYRSEETDSSVSTKHSPPCNKHSALRQIREQLLIRHPTAVKRPTTV
jgi:hypothetical protein